MTNTICVHHEWGVLKEVILGHGDDLIMPAFCDAVSWFYDPNTVENMKKYGGMKATEVEPETSTNAKKQIDDLAGLLETRGIIVHRSRRLRPAEMQYLDYVQKGAHFFYARDPMLVIGKNVVETAISIPFKVKERYALRPILAERVKGSDAQYVSMPVPTPVFDRDHEIYLEGGDVLLNGYEIYVGNSGLGSNRAGMEWLGHFLGPRYKVHEIQLSPEFEHLDCVLALTRPGLGVICRDGIVGEMPRSLQKWDFVDVSKDDAKKLAANLMVIDERTVVIDKQHSRVGEELTKSGVEVIGIPYDAVAGWGGGLRCSHHPLVRESVLR